MKKTLTFLIVLVVGLGLFASGVVEKADSGAVETTVSTYTPETAAERFFWALGYFTNYSNQGQYLEMDARAFAEGARAYADGVVVTDEQFNKIVEDYRAYLQEQVKDLGVKNLEKAEAFLAQNAKEPGVVTTESGLQYKVINEGTGNVPVASDTVNLDYTLTLLDGTVADSSVSRGTTSQFALSQVIKGFSEGLCLMKEGASYRFWIHPSLGYGEGGTSSIEPNSLLIFDVTLHSIVR